MFNYVGEDSKPLSTSDHEIVPKQVFQFDIEKEDYFLRRTCLWSTVTTTVFRVRIGKHIFDIPSGMFILCGCVQGSMDWLTIDEVIGRPIEVFVVDHNFAGWSLCGVVVEDQLTMTCHLPSRKAPIIPAMDDTGERVIITSQMDHFNKMKSLDFDAFFVN